MNKVLLISLVLVLAVSVGVFGCDGGGGVTNYTLTMAVSPAGSGTATDLIRTSPYPAGTVVSIQAVAAAGYQFINWSAPAGSFANPNAARTTFAMPAQDVTVTANFVGAYSLTMVIDPPRSGWVTDLTNASPYMPGTIVSIQAVTATGGEFLNWTAPAGTFANANAINTTFTMPAQDVTVTASFVGTYLPAVAVLGDYGSQLTLLLVANSTWAEERDWDVVSDIGDYAVVVVNQPDDPGETTFQNFLDAASDNGVGVVFTSSWWIEDPWGISLSESYLGDPAGQSANWGEGAVYYKVTEEHPIFNGWNVTDEITIITYGDCDHAWFWDYSGNTTAQVGSADGGLKGDAVAVSTYGGSTHVLLASLGPQWYTDENDWTDGGRTIFINAVLFAGGI